MIIILKSVPTEESRPKGKWKYGVIHSCNDGLEFQWRCSMCGHVEEDTNGMNYCPECGADMRGEAKAKDCYIMGVDLAADMKGEE